MGERHEATTERKQFRERNTSDFLPRFGWALLAGIPTVLGIVALMQGWWYVAVGVGVFLTLYLWSTLPDMLQDDALLMFVETATGRDLDGDGSVGEPEPDFDRLNDVAQLILRRVARGEDATREVIVDKLHLCTQPEWNAVNAACLKIGLRSGYTWTLDGYRQAWELWQQRTKVFGGHLWATDGRNWAVVYPSPTPHGEPFGGGT